MSNIDTQDTRNHSAANGRRVAPARRISTETKASFKTSEMVAYVLVAVAVLIAAAIVDVRDFGAQEAWFYVTILTVGYMISRGLAKSGSRDFYDDSADDSRTGR